MVEQVFFSGWNPIWRTAISTSVAYVILVVLLRIAGCCTGARHARS
jgi:hypothetical protein